MSTLGAFAASIIAIAIPSVYYAISINATQHTLTTEAAFLAKSIEKNIQARPDLWEFESVRLTELVSQPSVDGKAHEREIRTAAGRLVTKTDFTETGPIISVSATFFDSGRPAGSIVIRHSIRTQIVTTALLAILSSLLGYLIYFIFRTYPVRKLENTLTDLQRERDKSDKILTAIGDGVISVDHEGKILFINRAAESLVGMDTAEAVGRPLQEVYVLRRGQEDQTEEKGAILTSKGGKKYAIEEARTPLAGMESDRSGVVIAFRDVTERKKAEDELQNEKNKLDSIIGAMPSGLTIRDRDYNLIYQSPLTLRLFDNRIGEKCYQVFQHRETICEYCPVELAFQDGKPHTQVAETRLPDGRITYWENTAAPIRDSSGTIVSCLEINTDITERKLAEEELLRVQKLESLGVLAGGIAHDFNNLMMVVQGYIELVLMGLPRDHVSYERLLAAMQSVEQTKDLTSRLTVFSLGGGPIVKPCDVREIIRDTVHRTVEGTEVRAKFDFMKNLWRPDIDELQTKQCFYQLTTNAVEAMPQGGNLAIRAENVEIPTGDALPLKEGSYLKVTFTDEGTGIPEEHLVKVFDPYFTTKEMGARKGMGLGLSICYAALKQQNGHISVESKLGEGTSFALYLPVRTAHTEAKEVKSKLSPGAGRVLIMGDKPEIRDIERAYLEHMGYEVRETKDGREAVDVYRKAFESGAPFDLVILDLTVREGLGGQLAMEKLLMIDPGVRAIITSGYVDVPVVEHYGDYGFLGALKRPFKEAELKNIVETILHK
jgi:two-component system, cell cycle sensor histidine kinase and response regulator CckA